MSATLPTSHNEQSSAPRAVNGRDRVVELETKLSALDEELETLLGQYETELMLKSELDRTERQHGLHSGTRQTP